MSIFASMNNEGLEQATDNLGGSFTKESGIYPGTIKMAYAGASKGGARFIQFIIDMNGKEYKETLYFTNKLGANCYEKNGKKFPRPGFVHIDDICKVATGQPFSAQDTEEKLVKVYDYTAKAEVPTLVPVLVDLIGKPIVLAILKITENKSASDGNGGYVATAETRDINTIDKVFNEDGFTTIEVTEKAPAPVFQGAWSTRNSGKTRDKTTPVAAGGKPGAPGRPAPAVGTPRPNLFGKT
jgi:hypothetical protein